MFNHRWIQFLCMREDFISILLRLLHVEKLVLLQLLPIPTRCQDIAAYLLHLHDHLIAKNASDESPGNYIVAPIHYK